MVTRLDRQIEQLENLVEQRLNLCNATWNGSVCTQRANHEPTPPYKSAIEPLEMQGIAEPRETMGIEREGIENRVKTAPPSIVVEVPVKPESRVSWARLVPGPTVNYDDGDRAEFELALKILTTPMKQHISNAVNSNRTQSRPLRVIEKSRDEEYPAYAHIYIDLLPGDGLILKHLEDNLATTTQFLCSIPEARLHSRYAEGKWTIKEILGHVVDDERIYLYRALRFARNDSTELPGFDQDSFAHYCGANQREISDLLDEFALVRQSTIAFFNSLDDAALMRTGVGDGNRASVRALAYHIAGHEMRHMNIIRERYLR